MHPLAHSMQLKDDELYLMSSGTTSNVSVSAGPRDQPLTILPKERAACRDFDFTITISKVNGE